MQWGKSPTDCLQIPNSVVVAGKFCHRANNQILLLLLKRLKWLQENVVNEKKEISELFSESFLCFTWKWSIICINHLEICLQFRRPGFDPWVGKILWKRETLPRTPVFWPGESHGLYSPWGRIESDMTEQLSLTRSLTWEYNGISVVWSFIFVSSLLSLMFCWWFRIVQFSG